VKEKYHGKRIKSENNKKIKQKAKTNKKNIKEEKVKRELW